MKYEVWNKHPMGYTHREKFKGDEIVIKANDFVLMDYEDAVQFRGQYFPIKQDGMGQQDPISYKVIQLVPHVEDAEPVKELVTEFVCNRDGKKFTTQKELDAHIAANYKEEIYVDAAAEKELQRDLEMAAKIKGQKK